ncbi:G2/M phase-specific E3 ubiquitin-protein ligase-like isoform X1 [Myzus persicae]|uniref:G2/M phase-specific E3 ubiquitin-protein ligase-like isoform X1 n=1 Tax=Myzus persicae TaxID=13164 RepID=UPI000B93437E|nr:G2/M phase-specific E3 ubiquitin-protein ligase-like isoform X1 [Myzus persicae]
MAHCSKTVANSSLKYKSCNAYKCMCPFKEKRNYQIESSGSWEIVLCKTCSLYGTHRVCSFIHGIQDWRCKTCNAVADNLNSNGESSGMFREILMSVNRNMAINHIDTSSKTVKRSCNVEKCLCPHKEQQNYQEKIGSWEILLCHACGINGTHRICSFVKCFQAWYCVTCQAKSRRYH